MKKSEGEKPVRMGCPVLAPVHWPRLRDCPVIDSSAHMHACMYAKVVTSSRACLHLLV